MFLAVANIRTFFEKHSCGKCFFCCSFSKLLPRIFGRKYIFFRKMCFRYSCISSVCACVQKKILLIRNKVLSLQPEIRFVNPKIWLRESQRVEYLWGIFGIAKIRRKGKEWKKARFYGTAIRRPIGRVSTSETMTAVVLKW